MEVLPDQSESSPGTLRRFGLDVHDGPLQELAVVSSGLYRLRERLDETRSANDEELVGDTEILIVRIEDIADDLRRLAVATRDASRQMRPLTEALRRTTNLYSHACDVELHVDVHEAIVRPPLVDAIVRITQTALANIAQHSGALVARVTVKEVQAGIALEIYDDGIGFDVGEALARSARDERLGLTSVQERADSLGGTFELESERGGPTLLRVVFPI